MNNMENDSNYIDEDFYESDASGYCVLSAEENKKMQIWGYRESKRKLIFTWLLSLLTVGILQLLFHWKPVWRVFLTCHSCPLKDADLILIQDDNRELFLRRVLYARRYDGLSMFSTGGEIVTVNSYRFFTHRKIVYAWYKQFNRFRRLVNADYKIPCSDFHHRFNPLTSAEAAARFAVYGANEIVVQLKSISRLVFLEALNPFYVFQVFSVSVWFSDHYYYYASVIVLMSVGSIAVDVYQIRKNQKALRDTIASTGTVLLIRDGVTGTVPSTVLVPGDVIVVPTHGCVMACDAVLLTGNCIVNESVLTGESVPVTKTPIPKSDSSDDGPLYDDKHCAKHTLYNGTTVLQTRYYSGQQVKAVVLRTGFSTMKGQLVRSIMYPKPVDFEFTKDLLRFVGVLASIAGIGFLYTIILMTYSGISFGKILIRSLDIITIVVPPALPAAMTIGVMAAEQRLKKRNIFCISPTTINTCGGLNAVCFDKTGTLTEEGLDLLGVLDCREHILNSDISCTSELGNENCLLQTMACCHSLTRIDNVLTGDPLDLVLFRETGWFLEEPEVVEESGRYDMLAPTVVRPVASSGSLTGSLSTEDISLSTRSFEIGILRQFTFSSSLQRMSVVVRLLGSQDLTLFCKGAPETVAALCKTETVPYDFSIVLQKYTQKGYRVIAAATRVLEMSYVKAQRASREHLECDLDFCGLIILENRLKPETTPVINQLKTAKIRNIMVTGDNILTAVSVARECGILCYNRRSFVVEVTEKQPHSDSDTVVPIIKVKRDDFNLEDATAETALVNKPASVMNGRRRSSLKNGDAEDSIFITGDTDLSLDYQLAITGTSFASFCKYYPHLIPQLVAVCDVFARMAPEQKARLVNYLQELGYVVAMCGDGANDCGALKAAHAGISLSEAEASIASPFTSKIANIRCVVDVIKEGRAALVTSFGVFKYMASYSLTQFLSVSILYWIGTNLADFQFLYVDLFLITVFAICFGYTPAADTLDPVPPPTKILSIGSVVSICLQLLVSASFQIFSFIFITFQPWYIPFIDPGDLESFDAFQGTAIFLTSIYQYITLAIVYSKSYPYRKSIYTNRLFFSALILCALCNLWLTVLPPSFLVKWLDLKTFPFIKFRVLIVFIAGFNFLLSIFAEKIFIDWLLGEYGVAKMKKFSQKTVPKYVEILANVGSGLSWLLSATPSTIDSSENNVNPGGTATDSESRVNQQSDHQIEKL